MTAKSGVLITGGTGFIGSRLALHLLRQGHAVRTFSLRPRTAAERANVRDLIAAGAECREGSVTDADAVTLATAQVDYVYHLAAAQHESNVADDYYRQVNVEARATCCRQRTRPG